MCTNIFDNDGFPLSSNRIRQTIGAWFGEWFVAHPVYIQRRAKGEPVVFIQKDIYVTGILYQAHSFWDHSIQDIRQVQAGSQVNA